MDLRARAVTGVLLATLLQMRPASGQTEMSWMLDLPFEPDKKGEILGGQPGTHGLLFASQIAAAYQGLIYYAVHSGNVMHPSGIYRIDPRTRESELWLYQPQGVFHAIKVMDGLLFAAHSNGSVYWSDGVGVAQLAFSNFEFVTAMEAFNGRYFFATSQGNIRELVVDPVFGVFWPLRASSQGTIYSMIEWQGHLYAASSEGYRYSSRILRTANGNNWFTAGVFPSFAFTGFVGAPDRLYLASTENPNWASLAFWSTQDGQSWRRFHFTDEAGFCLSGGPAYFSQTGRAYFLSEWQGQVWLFGAEGDRIEERIQMPHGFSSLVELEGRLFGIGALSQFTAHDSPHIVALLGNYVPFDAGNQRPSVSITSPVSGAVFAPGETVSITVAASDPDGSVARVEFFINGGLRAVVTNLPFQASFSDIFPGRHTLTAKATDNLGAFRFSDPAVIRVGPANDQFAEAALIEGSSVTATGSNAGATREAGEPRHADNAGGASVWWRWTAPASGPVRIDTHGSGFDTLLAVYSQFNLFNAVAANDDRDGQLTSRADFQAQAGVTYFIAVDGYHGQSGEVVLNLQRGPANDDFARRRAMPPLAPDGRASDAGSNAGATLEPGEPQHAGVTGGASVWWTWTAPASGPAIISTSGSEFDTLLAVYTGETLGGLSLVAENDDSPLGSLQSRVVFNAAAGTTYQIAVDGFFGASGTVVLSVHLDAPLNQPPTVALASPAAGSVFVAPADLILSAEAADTDGQVVSVEFYLGTNLVGTASGSPFEVGVSNVAGGNYLVMAVATDDEGARGASVPAGIRVRPPNDLFSSGRLLSGDAGSVDGSNRGAALESGEPRHAGQPNDRSVWFRWTAPGGGLATFNTTNSLFDTVLGVYTGSGLEALTEVASDDSSGGGPFFASALTFTAQGGVEYHVALAGFAGGSGDYALHWEFQPGPGQAPRIITHPASLSVSRGQSATFIVEAAASVPLAFQWFFNGAALEGQTEPALTVSDVQPSKVGLYTVAVRTESSERAVLSNPAALEIGLVPEITSRNRFQLAAAVPQASVAADGGVIRLATTASVSAGSVGSQVLNNFDASREAGEPDHAGTVGGASRWFTLSPQTSGIFLLDTIGSTIDTVLAVYTGTSIFDLALVKSDDNSAPDGIRSQLNFDAAEGVEYHVAVDGMEGQQGEIVLNWQFGTAPVVTELSMDQTIVSGGSVTLSVAAASDFPQSYQWYREGVPMDGETGAELSLSGVDRLQGGVYTVVISNVLGQTVSPGIVLRVTEPIRLGGWSWVGGGQFRFHLAGEPEATYVIEGSGNLVDWETLFSGAAGADGRLDWTDPDAADGSRRYYRARLAP